MELRGGPAGGRWGPPPAPSPFAFGSISGTRAPHILCAIAARRRPGAGSAAAMTDLGDEYAARAATFRRLAGELKGAEDRAALLAIAEDYEARSRRLRQGAEGASQGPTR